LLNKNPELVIKEAEILYITQQIASGLKYMHSISQPIFHRDLKIENVLRIGKKFKICDFGSASTKVIDPV